jgi:hypothetical protein
MKEKGGNADQRLGKRIAEERIGEARRPASAIRRAGRHAAHEDREHQRLRVGRVAEKELQIMRPHRLVDQPGEPRGGEEDVEGGAWHWPPMLI